MIVQTLATAGATASSLSRKPDFVKDHENWNFGGQGDIGPNKHPSHRVASFSQRFSHKSSGVNGEFQYATFHWHEKRRIASLTFHHSPLIPVHAQVSVYLDEDDLIVDIHQSVEKVTGTPVLFFLTRAGFLETALIPIVTAVGVCVGAGADLRKYRSE